MTPRDQYQMTLLPRMLYERFGIEVPGDDVYWDSRLQEARVEYAEMTWFGRRIQDDDGNEVDVCGPVLYCPHCGDEAFWKYNADNLDELNAVLEEGPQCDCQHEALMEFVIPYPAILLFLAALGYLIGKRFYGHRR